jgi:pimeloyl-ACP methyl ester carboxylesterase
MHHAHPKRNTFTHYASRFTFHVSRTEGYLMATPSLHYEEKGEGMPLVLLHGFPLDHRIWQPQLAAVSTAARVLAPDLPGFGSSPPLAADPPTMDAYARAVLAWADGLGLRHFILAGHSMGGYVALAAARLAADRLAGLVLVASRAGADSAAARENRSKLAAAIREHGAQAAVDAMLPKLLAPGAGDRPAPVHDLVRAMMLDQPPAGLVPALQAMAARPDSTPALEDLTMPFLILHGAADTTIPPSEAEAMVEAAANALYVSIPAAGHLPMLEQPTAVNAALRDFLHRYWP